MDDPTNLATARREVAVRALKRKEHLAALNQYVEFGISKLFGVVALSSGTLDLLQPSTFGLSPDQAEAGIGLGLALIIGPKTVTLISKMLRAVQ